MKFVYKGVEHYIDRGLAYLLTSLVWNLKSDWDFVILLTGDRQVRIGKSVLAQQICAFIAMIMEQLGMKTSYGLDDIYFTHKKMMEEVIDKPQHSITHYDEARKSLASSKWSGTSQNELLDFFAECGQKNNVFVMVAPDFFGLREEFAVGRAELLINVFREDRKQFSKNPALNKVFGDPEGGVPITRFERGYFHVYNRRAKANLYDFARKRGQKSYGLVKHSLKGRFTKPYVVDEVDYRAKKLAALGSFRVQQKEERVKKNVKYEAILNHIIRERRLVYKETDVVIAEWMANNLGIDVSRSVVTSRRLKLGIV